MLLTTNDREEEEEEIFEFGTEYSSRVDEQLARVGLHEYS